MKEIRLRTACLVIALLTALAAVSCDQDRTILVDKTLYCEMYRGGIFTLEVESLDSYYIMLGDRDFYELMNIRFATFDLAAFPAWLASPEELLEEDGGIYLTIPFIGYVHMIAYTECKTDQFLTEISTEDLEGLAINLVPTD
ncbi:hypothetical protein ACFL4G_03515, partial [Thermodesulfobacteriota bacterium]